MLKRSHTLGTLVSTKTRADVIFMKQRRKGRIAIMQPCIRYYPHLVSFPLQILLLLFTLPRSESVFSISLSLCNSARIADEIVCWQMLKHILPGKRLKSNIAYTLSMFSIIYSSNSYMDTLYYDASWGYTSQSK